MEIDRNRIQKEVTFAIPFIRQESGAQSWSPARTVCVSCVHQSKCYVPGTSVGKRSSVPSAMPYDAMTAYVEEAALEIA